MYRHYNLTISASHLTLMWNSGAYLPSDAMLSYRIRGN
jgi:hypothetical protein